MQSSVGTRRECHGNWRHERRLYRRVDARCNGDVVAVAVEHDVDARADVVLVTSIEEEVNVVRVETTTVPEWTIQEREAIRELDTIDSEAESIL